MREVEATQNAVKATVERRDADDVVIPAGNADEPAYARVACERLESVLGAGTNGEMRERMRLDERQRRRELGGSDDVRDLANVNAA
jgi:hypothetical protein